MFSILKFSSEALGSYYFLVFLFSICVPLQSMSDI
mgnify:CR=1 FL=1